jgi:hypothetical protein
MRDSGEGEAATSPEPDPEAPHQITGEPLDALMVNEIVKAAADRADKIGVHGFRILNGVLARWEYPTFRVRAEVNDVEKHLVSVIGTGDFEAYVLAIGRWTEDRNAKLKWLQALAEDRAHELLDSELANGRDLVTLTHDVKLAAAKHLELDIRRNVVLIPAGMEDLFDSALRMVRYRTDGQLFVESMA